MKDKFIGKQTPDLPNHITLGSFNITQEEVVKEKVRKVVLETPEAKEKLWQDGDTMYYKQGVTDPDYRVLKFTAKKGRYYSNLKSEDFDI